MLRITYLLREVNVLNMSTRSNVTHELKDFLGGGDLFLSKGQIFQGEGDTERSPLSHSPNG